ncbi:MFS transporter [Teichococcus vastitatis]|uniref:MFS transporter n=1 Tax=Teichococcus vastitatis TaxID=2307076 RepID=A0ABS9WAI9_9PROT|nr:MFS transporter [Pseudoroseomonas vastitatis]MCI0756321.1 MFS transporter [Pseudoroseomonas vastitatis]
MSSSPVAAFAPLRHPAFRALWIANLASNTGLWIQNTGAGWLMTSLDPSPVMVSLVQAAAMLPVFLFALPGGALADILDRRAILIAAQIWIAAAGLLLAVLAALGLLGAWGLLALTFAIGTGTAVIFPAWAAATPELVPQDDLVQAVALNGVGFNLARALGPALGGFVMAAAGPTAAFALNAVGFLALLWALVAWRRPVERRSQLPPERLPSAVRAGLRFATAVPAMRAAILRACALFFFASAVWALMPLVIREVLGLGPAAFGAMLGVAGFGAVAAGTVLPMIRDRLSQGRLVFFASLLAYAAMALLAVSRHWAPAALAVLIFGAAWLAAGSTLGAAAQMTAPAWVRARALGVYHLAFFGALAAGSLLWGWVGTRVGVPAALLICAGSGAIAAVAVRPWRLVNFAQDLAQRVKARRGEKAATLLPKAEDPASVLKELLHDDSGRVLEVVRYQVDPDDVDGFLAAMKHVREVRLRAGAAGWRLYRDLARPDCFTELWAVDSWTEYLRHTVRLDEVDRAALALVVEMHRGGQGPEASRHLNVEP